MSDAVLSGSYTGFRLVKTRRVVVVEVELPIEALRQVLDVLGTPDPATETPVAVARLKEPAAVSPVPAADLPGVGDPQAAGASRPPDSIPAERGGKPRTPFGAAAARLTAHGLKTPPRPWYELTRAQQAGIRCGDERFLAFLENRYLMKMRKAEHDPAEFVRNHCGVSTRAHLDTDSIAAAMWDTLDAEYRRHASLEAEQR